MPRGKYLDHLGQSVTLLTLNLKQMNRGRLEIYYQLSFQSTVTPWGPSWACPCYLWLDQISLVHSPTPIPLLLELYSCWVSLLEYIVYFYNLGAKWWSSVKSHRGQTYSP